MRVCESVGVCVFLCVCVCVIFVPGRSDLFAMIYIITEYIMKVLVFQAPDYLAVDVHVFATPVLIDINRDGVIEELVIPTTHMFVEEDYE